MINNSVLSGSMSVAELAPKAAAQQLPERSRGNAFSEAMAGAHTVHDRRESQEATHARRDWAQGDRSVDRTRGQDRAAEVRSDASTTTDRTARPDAPERDEHAAEAGDGQATAVEATTAADDAAPTAEVAEDGSTVPVAVETTDAAPVAGVAAQATIAVAAAPVITDLDAIIVPTATTVTHVATDAIDAAMRLAIDADAAATTAVDADAPLVTTAASTTTTTTNTATAPTTAAAVDADVDVQLAAAVTPGAEDADAGDVNAGPMRPTTSVTASTSGPSPVQLAAATFATDEAAPTATTAQVAQQVAVSGAVDVAAGTTTDATTQLVQALAVDSDADVDTAPAATTIVDVEVEADAAATTAKTATKVDAAAGAGAQADLEVATDAEPEAVQAARLNQGQAPTVTANAQAQAQLQAQAKAAEQAAEEGSDAAPAKVEPAASSLGSLNGAARPDQAAAGVRVREAFQSAELQQRIDDIATQLATRLRLSQAAGGSQVQLSLKPRELGEVTVQMNVRDGAVAATILVDKADTLRTLQTNIEDLKRSLQDQGLTIGEFSVDVRGDSGAGGANARAAADMRGDNRSATGAAASAVAGASAAAPGLTGDREVDPEDTHDGNVSVLA